MQGSSRIPYRTIDQFLTRPLSREEIEAALEERLRFIYAEFRKGFEFIKGFEKQVTIFGSSRFSEDNIHYKSARRVAGRLAKLDYAIFTGGGPGIMEAANRGAYEAGGTSVGLTIALPSEQPINRYVTNTINFYYFFTRKVVMSFAAEAYIFYPGGYGTLNEFFEAVTLLQTGKIPVVPIILVGRDFWGPLDSYIRSELWIKHQSIDENDMTLYLITDDEEEVIERVKNAPVIRGLEFKPSSGT